MADKITLEIVTPDRQVLAEQVDEVVLPSVEGYMGVLPGPRTFARTAGRGRGILSGRKRAPLPGGDRRIRRGAARVGEHSGHDLRAGRGDRRGARPRSPRNGPRRDLRLDAAEREFHRAEARLQAGAVPDPGPRPHRSADPERRRRARREARRGVDDEHLPPNRIPFTVLTGGLIAAGCSSDVKIGAVISESGHARLLRRRRSRRASTWPSRRSTPRAAFAAARSS